MCTLYLLDCTLNVKRRLTCNLAILSFEQAGLYDVRGHVVEAWCSAVVHLRPSLARTCVWGTPRPQTQTDGFWHAGGCCEPVNPPPPLVNPPSLSLHWKSFYMWWKYFRVLCFDFVVERWWISRLGSSVGVRTPTTSFLRKSSSWSTSFSTSAVR